MRKVRIIKGGGAVKKGMVLNLPNTDAKVVTKLKYAKYVKSSTPVTHKVYKGRKYRYVKVKK